MHKRSTFFAMGAFVVIFNPCRAMLESIAAAGTAIGGVMTAGKPIVKEIEHLCGHNKRRRQRAQASLLQQATAQAEADKNSFLHMTQDKLIEKGSEALAETIVQTIQHAATAGFNALTAPQQPPLQGALQPAIAVATTPTQPQVIILKLKRHAAHRSAHHRHDYSSSEESSASSSESSEDSGSDSDFSSRQHHRHAHYYRPYNYHH